MPDSESIFSLEKTERCDLPVVPPIFELPEIADCDMGPIPTSPLLISDLPPLDGCDAIDGTDGTLGTDGQDGRDGLDGCDAIDGTDGIGSSDGQDGKDGIGNVYLTVLAEPYFQGQQFATVREPRFDGSESVGLEESIPVYVPYPLTQNNAPIGARARFYTDLNRDYTVNGTTTNHVLLDVGLPSEGGFVDEITVPVLIPSSNGLIGTYAEKFELLDLAETVGVVNARRMGLAKTGTEPLRVFTIAGGDVVPKLDVSGNPLYYRDISWEQNDEGWHVFTSDQIEQAVMDIRPDYLGWASLTALYCYLNSLNPTLGTVLKKVDYSDVWDVTTDSNNAIKRNHLVIGPTQCAGYWVYPFVSYAPEQNKTFSWSTHELTTDASVLVLTIPYCTARLPNPVNNQRLIGTISETFLIAAVDTADNVTYNDSPTLEEFFNIKQNQTRFVRCEWQNDRPLINCDVSIENTCADIPLLAVWKQGNVAQIVLCENIPYGYCIPLKKIECLTRVTEEDCSPVYSFYKYTLAVGFIDIQAMYQPLNADWIPSLGSCTD